MVTIDEIKQNLECSDLYIQKMIEWANGDERKLESLYYFKLAERQIRSAIQEVR